jgi:DNA-directed RNA polymerase subunit RPC12/RpoP
MSDEILEADDITNEAEDDTEDSSHDIIITGFPTSLASKVVPYRCGKCESEFLFPDATGVEYINFCYNCGTEFNSCVDLTQE